MRTVTWTVVALLAAVALVGYPLTPVTLTADSMAPTAQKGDTLLVVSWERAEVGDVVTFRTPERGYVTHRVVGTTPGGLVTKGDGNPTTDQAAGDPPVPRDAVVGPALALGGDPVTVPYVGVLLRALSRVRFWVLAGGLAALALGAFEGSRRRDASRPPRVQSVVWRTGLVCLAGAVALLTLGVVTKDLTYVATTGPAGGRLVPVGEAATRTLHLDVLAPPFTTTVVDARGVDVVSRHLADGGMAVRVRVPARADSGLVRGSVSVVPYPATLPRSVLVWLHDWHPMAARVGSSLPLFAPAYVLYRLAADGRSTLRAPNSRALRRWGGGR